MSSNFLQQITVVQSGINLRTQDLTCNEDLYRNLPTVTQITSTTTGVELNSGAGRIITQSFTLAANAVSEFTVTNNQVSINDYVVASISSYAAVVGTNGIPMVMISDIQAGSFDITVCNLGTQALAGIFVLGFSVIKRI